MDPQVCIHDALDRILGHTGRAQVVESDAGLETIRVRGRRVDLEAAAVGPGEVPWGQLHPTQTETAQFPTEESESVQHRRAVVLRELPVDHRPGDAQRVALLPEHDPGVRVQELLAGDEQVEHTGRLNALAQLVEHDDVTGVEPLYGHRGIGVDRARQCLRRERPEPSRPRRLVGWHQHTTHDGRRVRPLADLSAVLEDLGEQFRVGGDGGGADDRLRVLAEVAADQVVLVADPNWSVAPVEVQQHAGVLDATEGEDERSGLHRELITVEGDSSGLADDITREGHPDEVGVQDDVETLSCVERRAEGLPEANRSHLERTGSHQLGLRQGIGEAGGRAPIRPPEAIAGQTEHLAGGPVPRIQLLPAEGPTGRAGAGLDGEVSGVERPAETRPVVRGPSEKSQSHVGEGSLRVEIAEGCPGHLPAVEILGAALSFEATALEQDDCDGRPATSARANVMPAAPAPITQTSTSNERGRSSELRSADHERRPSARSAAHGGADDLVDPAGQLEVPRGEPGGVMGGELDRDPVVDVGPLGMVVELLGPHRHLGHDPEGFDEGSQHQLATQPAAIDQVPLRACPRAGRLCRVRGAVPWAIPLRPSAQIVGAVTTPWAAGRGRLAWFRRRGRRRGPG